MACFTITILTADDAAEQYGSGLGGMSRVF
jgi:hypothetical protein